MDIAAKIIELLQARAADRSICPSDVARALGENETAWRDLMRPVRDVAADLAREGRIVVTQGAHAVDPDDIHRGAIRLRRGPRFNRG